MSDYVMADFGDDGRISVVADMSFGGAHGLSRIAGCKRDRVMRPDGLTSWKLPASLDVCEDLRNLGVPFTHRLEVHVATMLRILRYCEHVKKSERVDPLQPVPIKAPYSLYPHQINAYNVALALFGRGAKKRGGDSQ